MLIENKWVVYDKSDDVYYMGDRGGGPIFESLNSRVRTYKSEKSAKSAVRYISGTGSERVEFCVLRAVYIKCEDVPDAPDDEPDKGPEMREVTDWSGWEDVFACARPISKPEQELGKLVDFLKIRLCRKTIANVEIFGIRTADDRMYSAGVDGGELALRRFAEEIYNYLLPRVSRQSGNAANPERGMRSNDLSDMQEIAHRK